MSYAFLGCAAGDDGLGDDHGERAEVAPSAGLGKLTLQNATDTSTLATTASDPYSPTPTGAYSTAIVPGRYDLTYGV